MKKKYFDTSFGRRIDFVDGYRDSHDITTDNLKVLSTLQEKSGFNDPKNIEKRNQNLLQKIKQTLENDGFFSLIKKILLSLFTPDINIAKDYIEYSLFRDFLINSGKLRNWNNLLDIGGREGHIARIMKYEGIAKNVETIDILNMKRPSNKSLLINIIKSKVALRLKPSMFKRLTKGNFGWKVDGEKLNKVFSMKSISLDNYIIGDFLNHKFNKKYDLITAFLCIEYLDLEKLLIKAYDLLEDGGTFAFLVNYWYWPVNSTEIVGDFPWAIQRLTRDDVSKYFGECYPDEHDDIMERYDYFHQGKQRPTLTDYIESARKVGFNLSGYQRFTPNETTAATSPFPPTTLENFNDISIEEVLEDIRCFAPNVVYEDLKTSDVLCIFTKEKTRINSSDFISSLKVNGYNLYVKEK